MLKKEKGAFLIKFLLILGLCLPTLALASNQLEQSDRLSFNNKDDESFKIFPDSHFSHSIEIEIVSITSGGFYLGHQNLNPSLHPKLPSEKLIWNRLLSYFISSRYILTSFGKESIIFPSHYFW